MRKIFSKYLPHPDTVRAHRLVAPFGGWLHHPNLWCLNRRSVAGAVAIGLFCGLIPGPLQMLGAVLLAIPLHKNIPVAMLVTLYTNPLTIVPLYLLAYGYGVLLLGGDEARANIEPFVMDWANLGQSLSAFWHWLLMMGKPLAVGLLALALTLAAAGYATVRLGWRAYVSAAWRRRQKRRRAR